MLAALLPVHINTPVLPCINTERKRAATDNKSVGGRGGRSSPNVFHEADRDHKPLIILNRRGIEAVDSQPAPSPLNVHKRNF